MLGEGSADGATKLLKNHGFEIKGKFAHPVGQDKPDEVFELTKERIEKVSQVVQFLE